jgi:hypothetical protein
MLEIVGCPVSLWKSVVGCDLYHLRSGRQIEGEYE